MDHIIIGMILLFCTTSFDELIMRQKKLLIFLVLLYVFLMLNIIFKCEISCAPLKKVKIAKTKDNSLIKDRLC